MGDTFVIRARECLDRNKVCAAFIFAPRVNFANKKFFIVIINNIFLVTKMAQLNKNPIARSRNGFTKVMRKMSGETRSHQSSFRFMEGNDYSEVGKKINQSDVVRKLHRTYTTHWQSGENQMLPLGTKRWQDIWRHLTFAKKENEHWKNLTRI